jgi:hypothetical protein
MIIMVVNKTLRKMLVVINAVEICLLEDIARVLLAHRSSAAAAKADDSLQLVFALICSKDKHTETSKIQKHWERNEPHSPACNFECAINLTGR